MHLPAPNEWKYSGYCKLKIKMSEVKEYTVA